MNAPTDALLTSSGLPASQAADLLARIQQSLYLMRDGRLSPQLPAMADFAGFIPPSPMEQLGDASFRYDYGARYAYYAGAMANGIASVELVQALAVEGFLAFFGAAGLAPAEVERAIDRLSVLGEAPYGFNLIHSPGEKELEANVVDLYLRRSVRTVEASAYLALTLPVVRYRVHGIHRGRDGRIVTPNRVIAKVSRVEVASKFFAPPPEAMLRELVLREEITQEQAELAAQIPVAQDITAEADSGGHTDNRPAIALLPTLIAVRDRFQEQYKYTIPLRVGLGGGISTPASAVGAFAMGAAYIVTGSVNQACVESGSSDVVREMLAAAEQADVTMAPAADMFEMGVQLQVLKRGTMFPMRARQLYQLYRAHGSLEAIGAPDREKLEKTIFRAPMEEIWAGTRQFFQERDPSQIAKAEKDPKHKMALVFRWYLGMSSRWANRGDETRKADYQVWCGPAMGAFNEWAKGSFLEKAENRRAVEVAKNILFGAAVLSRANSLRAQGYPAGADLLRVPPRTESEISGLAE